MHSRSLRSRQCIARRKTNGAACFHASDHAVMKTVCAVLRKVSFASLARRLQGASASHVIYNIRSLPRGLEKRRKVEDLKRTGTRAFMPPVSSNISRTIHNAMLRLEISDDILIRAVSAAVEKQLCRIQEYSAYVDMKGACAFLNVGETQFKEWVKLGFIKPRKVSSHLVRYCLEELRDFIEQFKIDRPKRP